MKIFATAAATSSVISGCESQSMSKAQNGSGIKHPNILIIIADQLSQKALPSYGDKYADAPNIESIMKNGVRFSQVYTPCPLCQPARSAFWTSHYPHQTNVTTNLPTEPQEILGSQITKVSPMTEPSMTTLGDVFSSSGYICRHFGKMHDAGALRGFECDDPAQTLPVERTHPAWPVNLDTTRDRYTAQRCVDFLESEHDKPFIAVADFNNPHNICGWVGENQGEHTDVDIDSKLPELPDNFEVEDMETRAPGIQYLCCTHPRLNQAAHWNKENYRHYLAAYYHYLKVVDDEIGLVLNALKHGGYDDNTLIVFMADHGDGMSCHRMTTKRLSFYDETTRIPFAFAGPGIKDKDMLIEKPLVSTLDLVPTLCDYAGVAKPQSLEGQSLMHYLNGKGEPVERDYLISQWHAEWNFTYEPGRMLRTDRYKYIKYAEERAEEFYDLEKDPGEKKNLINDASYKDIIDKHRKMFASYLKDKEDPFESMQAVVDPRWRSHKLGYQNHEGGSIKDFPPPKELQ
ncbi:MAG: sulfatase [Sedimentisphaeraceae bacterium JB056]